MLSVLPAFTPLPWRLCGAGEEAESSRPGWGKPLFNPFSLAIFARVSRAPSSTTASAATAGGDAELMARVASGEEAAFTELYRKFAPGLYSMIYAIVGTEAEDVLQDAFVQMWKRASTYDPGRSNVFTWAVMICRHKAIDRLRSRQRRELGTESFQIEALHTAPMSEGLSGSAAAAQSDERAGLLVAMTQLPPEQREAIELAFFSGLTHADISSRLTIPLGTIKARIRRGLLALQTLLPS